MKTNMGREGFSLPFGRLKSPLRAVKNTNPSSPPFSKGGLGGFEVCALRFGFNAMRFALCYLWFS
jgi:hypothetical protein